MKKLALLILTIVILGAAAYSGYEWIYTKKTIFQEERVDSADIEQVVVRTSSANVEVLPADSEEIEVVLKGKSSKNDAKNYQFKVKESDGKLHIQYIYKENAGWFQFGGFHEMKLQIRLPEKDYKQLMVKSSSGNISVNKVEVESALLTSTSGNISLTEAGVANQLSLESTSGSIKTVKNKVKTAKLRSTSGNIEMRRLEADQSSFHTSSGNIEISNEKLAGDMTMKTTSGNVGVEFMTQPDSVKIDFLGSSGTANIDLDGLVYEDQAENSARGVKGKGKHRIKVRTSSGDFTLRETNKGISA